MITYYIMSVIFCKLEQPQCKLFNIKYGSWGPQERERERKQLLNYGMPLNASSEEP